MRIEPSCAVNRQPACVANASEAAIGASSRVFTSEEMMPGRGPEPEQVEEVVALDADQRADGDAEHDRHAGGSAADDQRTVAPGDVGEQPDELAAVVPQRDRHAATARTKNTSMCPSRMTGVTTSAVQPDSGHEHRGSVRRCRHLRAPPAGTA